MGELVLGKHLHDCWSDRPGFTSSSLPDCVTLGRWLDLASLSLSFPLCGMGIEGPSSPGPCEDQENVRRALHAGPSGSGWLAGWAWQGCPEESSNPRAGRGLTGKRVPTPCPMSAPTLSLRSPLLPCCSSVAGGCSHPACLSAGPSAWSVLPRSTARPGSFTSASDHRP